MILFVVAAMLYVAVVVILRVVLVQLPLRRLARTRPASRPESASTRPLTYRDLSPLELAFLAGGPKRAMLAAMAALPAPNQPYGMSDHVMTSSHVPALTQKLEALGTHNADIRQTSIRDACRPELDAIGARLEPLGPRGGDRKVDKLLRRDRRLRLSLLAPAGVVVAGFVVAALAGSGAAAALMWLAPLILFLVFAWCVPRNRSFPRSEARRILDDARTDFAHLDPAHSPAFSAYGAEQLQLATALFGGAAMASTPVFAQLPLFQTVLVSPTFSGREHVSCSAYSCGVDAGTGCGGSCSGSDKSCNANVCGRWEPVSCGGPTMTW